MKTPILNLPPQRIAPLLLLATSLLACSTAAHAQTATSQTPPSQATQDQYTGVSHPPADDTIVANDDTPPPQAVAKPTPYVAPSSPEASSAPTAAASSAPVAPVENPDYGIVTSVDSPAQAAPSPDMPVHLISRPVDPGYGIVDMVPTPANELAEGTDIHVRLLQPLSTTSTQVGQVFRAQVAADVYKDGRVVIPMGAELRGRVTEVSEGHRMGTHATIRLRPDDIILPDGTAYHLTAEAVQSSAPGTQTDDEGAIQSTHHVGKDITEYGVGAGSVAAVGGVLAGPVGAGAGAIVGASMVTTHLLLQKPAQARMETGSEIVFSLNAPMNLVPTKE